MDKRLEEVDVACGGDDQAQFELISTDNQLEQLDEHFECISMDKQLEELDENVQLISMDKQLEELHEDFQLISMDKPLEELDEDFQLIAMDKRLEELDEDVLYWILSYCSLPDYIRMGAVCKSWLSISKWSISSLPPQLPWLMMLSNSDSTSVEEDRCFFSLSDSTIYDAIKFPEICGKRCCGSFNNAGARGWLMTIDDENLEMRLFHPWRRIQLQLPTPSTLPCRYVSTGHPNLAVMKIRTAAMSDNADVVVVIHEASRLAFCRIGDNVWTHINTKGAFDDVIYHKGQFYVVSIEGRVGVLCIDDFNPNVEIISEEFIGNAYTRAYLVADSASGRLFILVRKSDSIGEVVRDPYNYDSRRTSGFKVYELGLEETGEYKKNPVELESLSDWVIFLGQNSSMLVSASQYPGFKGNIYFTDDFMEASCFKSPLGCVDLGVFNMEDKTIRMLLSDRFHPTLSPPIWVVPPL